MGTDIIGGDRHIRWGQTNTKHHRFRRRKMVERQFYPFFKTTSKPSRHSQDNLPKTFRKLSETIQTTVRHLEDTSDNLFRHLTVLKYDSTGWVGGWVGGPHCIIIPLRGPTCKLRTCKNSSELEFQVGLSVAKIPN